MAINPGDIISHAEMCANEKMSLQRGMNFGTKGRMSIILMSRSKNAPYEDEIQNGGKILIYEGHDVPNTGGINPKNVDQEIKSEKGTLTQNGKFYNAVVSYKNGESPELVKVYEKIKQGIWVYNGVFKLLDAWKEKSGVREVFKFKLEITDKDYQPTVSNSNIDLDHNRMIPTSIKLEVWKRDKGKCVTCGAEDNLHFDHILPYSKGGTSLKAENIQLLCARHNLQKRDKIQ